MSTEITTAFVQQYGSAVYHLAQQKGARLRGAVRSESQVGKSAFYDQIGASTASVRASRHADTPITDTPHSRRRVTLVDYEVADLVDQQDKIRLLIDPTSAYVQSQAMALGRAIDDAILDASIATAYTGETGSGTATLGNTNRVASVASSAIANLNVQALRKAKYLLDSGNVDPSTPRYLALNASALSNLLSQTEVTSSDYNSVKALVQGEVDTFMGFKFILTERVNTSSGSFTFNTTTGLYDSGGSTTGSTTAVGCMAWAQDGLLLSIGKDIVSRVSERADKSYAMQAYSCLSVGATRMEEAKVVEILCAQ